MLIFFVDCVRAEATRTPVKDEVSMVSVVLECARMARRAGGIFVREIFVGGFSSRVASLKSGAGGRADETRERG